MNKVIALLLANILLLAIQISLPVWQSASFAAGTESADDLFKLADSADICENFHEAIRRYLDLISKVRHSDPGNSKILRAQARLGRIYVLLKKFDAAEPYFHILMLLNKQQLTADPELLIDIDDMSDAYLTLKSDPHYAYESMKRCISLRNLVNPKHPKITEAMIYISNYCLRCNNMKEAMGWIQRALAVDEQSTGRAHTNVIRDLVQQYNVYYFMHELDLAKQTAHRALTEIKKCRCGLFYQPQIHLDLGRFNSLQGQYDLADKEYQLSVSSAETVKGNKKEWAAGISKLRHENDMRRLQAGGSH